MNQIAVILAIASYLFAQDVKKCDMKNVEDALWCRSCMIILDENTSIKEKYCKTCNEGKDESRMKEGLQIQICVKKYFKCPTHKRKVFEKCCDSASEEADRWPIVQRCTVCKGWEFDEEKIKHNKAKHKDNKDADVITTCLNSGNFPHTVEK